MLAQKDSPSCRTDAPVAPGPTLLAHDRARLRGDGLAARVDTVRRGAVARRYGRHTVRRAEPGPCGPLVLEASVRAGRLERAVWGPSRTPAEAVNCAMVDLRGWTGQEDDPRPLRDVVASHDLLRRVLREVGEVRLGRLPRVSEALGRAIVHQLVQRTEATRSVAQLVQRFGEPVAGDLATWPTAAQIGAMPAWDLRRCGVSLQGARALHAAAVDDRRLRQAAAAGMPQLDARLRSLPGVGVWTSAEVRLALGDPDAVSVGDYHVHTWVTHTLGGVDPRASTDAHMLELLEPFAGQRGRVVALIGVAYRRGLLPPPPRRGPHAPLSAHRYW